MLLPLSAIVLKAASLTWPAVAAAITSPRAIASYRVTLSAALSATIFNALFGMLLAWILVRYDFPGRRLLDAAIDLPFALPTAVAGIALTAVYAPNGWIGAPLAALGVKVAFTPIGVFIALVFIGLPFMVRSIEPVLAEFDPEVEEASATLGASRLRTVFQVVLPPLAPAFITGFALSLARAVGEYGSVVFISGNIPFVSEIAPLLIVVRLEEFDEPGATAVASIMLAISFAMLLLVNIVQHWTRRKLGHG